MAELLSLDDPVLLKRLAKYIVQQCFRNTVLEDYHAGIVPGSKTGDYSDVVVNSPFGEIKWNDLSRISDEEMKALMREAVNRTHRLLRTLMDEQKGKKLLLRLSASDPVPRWDDPVAD